jgi:hypothetical protein
MIMLIVLKEKVHQLDTKKNFPITSFSLPPLSLGPRAISFHSLEMEASSQRA